MMYQHASRIYLYVKSWIKGDYISRLRLVNEHQSTEKTDLFRDSVGDSDISAWADLIKTHADTLARYAIDKNIRPSLAIGGDTLKIDAADKCAVRAKAELLFAIKSLQSLVKGPLEILMDIGVSSLELAWCASLTWQK